MQVCGKIRMAAFDVRREQTTEAPELVVSSSRPCMGLNRQKCSRLAGELEAGPARGGKKRARKLAVQVRTWQAWWQAWQGTQASRQAGKLEWSSTL